MLSTILFVLSYAYDFSTLEPQRASVGIAEYNISPKWLQHETVVMKRYSVLCVCAWEAGRRIFMNFCTHKIKARFLSLHSCRLQIIRQIPANIRERKFYEIVPNYLCSIEIEMMQTWWPEFGGDFPSVEFDAHSYEIFSSETKDGGCPISNEISIWS